jgi:hypothetical protein
MRRRWERLIHLEGAVEFYRQASRVVSLKESRSVGFKNRLPAVGSKAAVHGFLDS